MNENEFNGICKSADLVLYVEESTEKHDLDCECLECTDFRANSSFYGLKMYEFSSLDEELKLKLKGVMARIMERAYRRGVQQTITLYEDDRILPNILNNLHDYRYNENPDISIGLDGFKTSSLERLEMEESLNQVGL